MITLTRRWQVLSQKSFENPTKKEKQSKNQHMLFYESARTDSYTHITDWLSRLINTQMFMNENFKK